MFLRGIGKAVRLKREPSTSLNQDAGVDSLVNVP